MTPFPATAREVVTLPVAEFSCELELNASCSFDRACERFCEDANLAVVWLIRFRALMAWCERTDMSAWLQVHPASLRHACEIAASFALNDEWEFDAEPFRSAILRQIGR